MNDTTKVALVAIAIILIVGAISYANYGYETQRMDNRGTATTSNSYAAPQNTRSNGPLTGSRAMQNTDSNTSTPLE